MVGQHIQTTPFYVHDINIGKHLLYMNKYSIRCDDSLFSHYYYYDYFKKSVILAVTTSYLHESSKLRKRFIQTRTPLNHLTCYDYTRQLFEGKKDVFMTYEELVWLSHQPNVIIMFHSHWHLAVPSDNSQRPISQTHSLWQEFYDCHSKMDSVYINPHYKDFIEYDFEAGLILLRYLLKDRFSSYFVAPYNRVNDFLISIASKFGLKVYPCRNLVCID